MRTIGWFGEKKSFGESEFYKGKRVIFKSEVLIPENNIS